jgi:2-amino-4-hydroxy-6-hydroxymethyldihydropteridine diphosphokinase
MSAAYIGIGSNLDDPVRRVRLALDQLQRLPQTTLRRRSSLYRSAPIGPGTQADYINAVAELETGLTPHALLESLHGIEQQQGRVRGAARWTPRTLDLDLLLYGADRISEPDLTVPHPEIARRNFVLAPLVEIEPGIGIPGLGDAQTLLRRVGLQQLQRLAADE